VNRDELIAALDHELKAHEASAVVALDLVTVLERLQRARVTPKVLERARQALVTARLVRAENSNG